MFSQVAIGLLIDICLEDARTYPDSAHPFWAALVADDEQGEIELCSSIDPSLDSIPEEVRPVTIFRYEEAP